MSLFEFLRNALYKTPWLRQVISTQPFTYFAVVGYLVFDGIDPDAVLHRVHLLLYGLLAVSIVLIALARLLSHVDHELLAVTKAMRDARRATRGIRHHIAELVVAIRDGEPGEDDNKADEKPICSTDEIK
jgi:hypothetical protein